MLCSRGMSNIWQHNYANLLHLFVEFVKLPQAAGFDKYITIGGRSRPVFKRTGKNRDKNADPKIGKRLRRIRNGKAKFEAWRPGG